MKTTLLAVAAACACPLIGIGGDMYGVCAHISRPGEFETRIEEMRLMKEAGIGWCRTDFDWKYVEPRQGEWTFGHLDRLMDDADRIGVRILPILDYEVPWAYHPWADEHIGRWREYVRRVVSRYRGRCPVWEVWNEQNCGQGAKHPFPSPNEYVALLKAAYEEIKSADPAARVAIGGFAGVPFSYIEGVYEAGGREYFDIMNVHPYQGSDKAEHKMAEQFRKLRALMEKHGDGTKPVWVTEIGLMVNESEIAFKGLLRAALANIDAKRSWRVLYTDRESTNLESIRSLLKKELSGVGGEPQVCLFADLEARLGAGGVDALVLPLSEEYPADAMDAICAFVKDGGTVVDFGGMAMFKPVTWKGLKEPLVGAPSSKRCGEDRLRLRFADECWFTNARIPHRFPSSPTAAFRSQWSRTVKSEQEVRCFKPAGLKDGDEFIPLLTFETNGYRCVSMARIRYGSDFRGNLVLGGFFERRILAHTGEWQGKGCARQLNQCYAMGYDKVFWYEFQRCSGFGIVRRKTFEPCDAYLAYKAFITARPSGSVRDGTEWMAADGDICRPTWTRPDGRKAGAVWSISGKGTAPSCALGAAEYRDWLGRPLTALPDPLPDTPVYFVRTK